MNKKGTDLSINMIIVAALALLVLIVMMMIFTGKMQVLGQSSDCKARGGDCVQQGSCTKQVVGYTCTNQNEVCCIDPLNIR